MPGKGVGGVGDGIAVNEWLDSPTISRAIKNTIGPYTELAEAFARARRQPAFGAKQ